MPQHGLWASYTGTARITLAVILLVAAAAVAFSGARLRRPVRLPHPGRVTTTVILTVWVVVMIVAFVAVVSALIQQAHPRHSAQAPVFGPIAPITFTAVGVTFVVILLLGRSYDWPVRLGGAVIGAVAAPMIFEFPFDFIIMTRIRQAPAAHLVLYFVPLFLIEIITLSLLTTSPMVRLRRVTCFGFASMLAVFAIWALFGFGYPGTEPAYTLNVVSKLLAFVTALTLFLPAADRDRPGGSPSPR